MAEQLTTRPANPDSAVWHRLWEKLILTAADRQNLQEVRGFSDEVIDKLGFKSSQAQNRPILEALCEEFPPDQLARAGVLFKSDEGNFYPNRVFCGYGRTGEFLLNADGSFKLSRAGKKQPERKAGLNPTLIPYLGADGKVEIIKPHKDNVPNPVDVDKLDDEFTGHHLYCEQILRIVSTSKHYTDGLKNFCLITEGEFKAAALLQCGIPALGLPGIHSVRNVPFRRHLIEVLKRFGITDVVICFDNEIKDDPDLPNYKADEWARVDTIVYARYTAATLYREGIKSTKIANLPDEWRRDGKADWDGALARFVKEAGDIEKGTVNARREFLKVIKAARIEQDCRDLFASTLHRIIEAKLARLYHVPRCPVGGDNERRLGWSFKRLDNIPAALDYRYQLAHGFTEVYGVHYTRKPVKKQWREDELAAIAHERDTAKDKLDWPRYHYFKELMLGIPKPLSNFKLSCKFKLISADGKMEYLVSVRNIHKEHTEQHVRIDGGTLSSLREFRKWLLSNVGVSGTWHGGERDLQDLTADMQADSAFREIHEIDTYGFSDQCNLWKYADRAFTPDDKELLPDKDMVFWYNGIGYQTDFDKRRIGDGFKQGAPTLGQYDEAAAIESFLLLKKHIFYAIGDFSGWLAIGAVVAYAVHPEIFRTYMGVPGIWFTGRGGGGKSTIAEWLIQIFGFNPKINTSLKSGTTHTSIGRELSKYGCLPLPLDEFDATKTDERIQGQLHNAFTRLADLKATYDNTKRTRGVKPETTPFVLGENSCRNSTTRGRYINISILDTKAVGDRAGRLKEMNAGASKFPNLGHFIMRNRTRYADKVMSKLEAWVSDPVIAKFVPPVRQRFISGLPYAAFIVLAEMLRDTTNDSELKGEFTDLLTMETDFRTFAMEHGSESQKEVTDTSYVNEFWQDLLNLIQVSDGHLRFKRFFSIKYADIVEDEDLAGVRRIVKTSEIPRDDRTPVMFVAYDAAYHIYTQEIRKGGREARLSIGDLKRELKREKYWLWPKKDESHKMSIEGIGRPVCWVFDLIQHPYGEQLIDALQAKHSDPQNSPTSGQTEADL